jgi:hydrogenase maturation protein HypF
VIGQQIRVRGLVQGVGFRPYVWRLATAQGLYGDVCNDGEGVLIHLWGTSATQLDKFYAQLLHHAPPLARIVSCERQPILDQHDPSIDRFVIIASPSTNVQTDISPDINICADCHAEILDPSNRRYRYPFTNCTNCGPRLSILQALPYDRAQTSLASFPLCPTCQAEYSDPLNRRFHAQPNACSHCGPTLWLEEPAGQQRKPSSYGATDVIYAASQCLRAGKILAIHGIGGFHLVCDASQPAVVMTLRQRKQRPFKPLALMARDLICIEQYAVLNQQERELLQSPMAPIVLLTVKRHLDKRHAEIIQHIAPGQETLGFMLPHTPLQVLLLQAWSQPLVMTSANRQAEPTIIDPHYARTHLVDIADAWLIHNRAIIQRVDDSIVRVRKQTIHIIRRARGYVPQPLPIPKGFTQLPTIFAAGGDLKSAGCFLNAQHCLVLPHLGDLSQPRTAQDYEHTLERYQHLFHYQPTLIAVDRHPQYYSTRFGKTWAEREHLQLISIQHHHAHLGAVLAEHQWPYDGGSVLGLILDGSGYGDDGTVWGGELFYGDYRHCQRIGQLTAVPLPGGDRAIREPWRHLFAQLDTLLGWQTVLTRWPDVPCIAWLARQPIQLLQQMCRQGFQAPLTSSCGRLFDAVAVALRPEQTQVTYEGQAAIELATLAQSWCTLVGSDEYPWDIEIENDAYVLSAGAMWRALLHDLVQQVPLGLIAARFELGLAHAWLAVIEASLARYPATTLVLSGGVFQNQMVLQAMIDGAEQRGLQVLTAQQLPCHDGGLAVGQAFCAAAQVLAYRDATG